MSFKNNTNAPVPYRVGDDVVMVPPGGQVQDNAVHADYSVPAPYATNATDSGEAFAAAAFRASNGVPPLPEVHDPLELPTQPEVLPEVEPVEVRGAEVVTAEKAPAKALPNDEPVEEKPERVVVQAASTKKKEQRK